MVRRIVLSLAFVCLPLVTFAQPIGTYRWQTQTYCNVVTVAVTQNGAVYELAGWDDQCGAATRAAATGVAFQNPDGSIGIGLTIVGTPGGGPVHLDATVLPAAGFNGQWRDSAGRSGAFVLTPGAGTGGSPRPLTFRPALSHTSAAANITAACTYIDNPLTNDDPNAMLFVTHVYPSYYNKAVGVYFNADATGTFARKWCIYNEDASAFGAGAKFQVLVIKQ